MRTVKAAFGVRLEDGDDLAAEVTKTAVKIWIAERTVKVCDAVLLIERLRTLIDAARTQQQNLR